MDSLKTMIESTPYAEALGVEVVSINEDSAAFVLPFKEENSNPGKALHGGVAASMINLGGLAVARAALGEPAAPLHTFAVQVNYLAAAIGEPILTEAKLLRRGKELCFVDVAVRTEEGKPIARGLATVRGRFGADPSDPPKTSGDEGLADPGIMGPGVPKRVPFIGRLGLEIEHMAAGRSRITMAFNERNADGEGGVHEGATLALLDTAGAMASWSVTGPGAYKASTVGVHAQFIAKTGREDLVAYGRVVHQDREVFWSDVEVAEQTSERVVARGTVFYRIVVPENAGS